MGPIGPSSSTFSAGVDNGILRLEDSHTPAEGGIGGIVGFGAFGLETSEIFDDMRISAVLNPSGDSDDLLNLTRGHGGVGVYGAGIDFTTGRMEAFKLNPGGVVPPVILRSDRPEHGNQPLLTDLKRSYFLELDIIGVEIDARAYDRPGGDQLLHLHLTDDNLAGPGLPPAVGGISVAWLGENDTNLGGTYDDLSAVRLQRGDFDANGIVGLMDLDALAHVLANGRVDHRYDVNYDSKIDREDQRIWVEQIRKTWFGDANLDGLFDTSDLISVFKAGEYEDSVSDNSTWSDGDWNADLEFDTGDLTLAFQSNGYEQGPRQAGVAMVPEPSSIHFGWMSLGVLLVLGSRRGGCGAPT
jgi:hypothetical protein